jgi:hypothetical protein
MGAEAIQERSSLGTLLPGKPPGDACVEELGDDLPAIGLDEGPTTPYLTLPVNVDIF